MPLRLTGIVRSLGALVLLAGAYAAAAQVAYQRFQLRDHQLDRMLSREYSRCMDNSGGVTVQMRDCAAAEMDRFDARLNAAYRAAMTRLPGAGRPRLRDLQRVWLRTRWSACHRLAEREGGGGTMALLILDSCELEEMARRIAWLERYGR